MAVLAQCDICGYQHRAKESLIGNSIRCKDCGVSFVVPADQVITPEVFVEENGRLRRRNAVQDRSAWPRIAAALISLVLVLVTVLCIWGLVQLIRTMTPNSAIVIEPQALLLKVEEPDNPVGRPGAIDPV